MLNNMKKLLLPLLIFAAGYAHGQAVTRNNGAVTAVDARLFTKSLKIPVYADTAHALAASLIDSIGLIFKEYGSSKVWIRDSNLVAGGHIWTLMGSGGSSFYDSTSGNAMQTKYRSDSARVNTYATISSLQTTLTTAINLKKNITDSSVNSPSNYATQGRVRKLEDSLNAVIAAAVTQLLAIQDTLPLLRTGARGDTIIRAAGGNFYTPGWVDSLHFHHLPNGDGTWAFFISDIPSAPFRFLDSICFTINGVRACVLDSAGGSGGGAVSSVADDGTGTTVTTPTTGAVKVAVNQAFGFSWTLAHAFGAGLSSGGDINLTGTTGTLHFGSLAKVAAIVYSRNWISDGDASIVPGNNANLNLNLETGGTNYIVIKGFGPTKDIWMGRGGSPADDSKSLLHLNGLITADSALHLINIAATAAQDTTNYKPLGINLSTGNVQAMVNWPGGGGGAGSGGIGKDSIITITSGTSSTVTSGYNIVQFNPTSVISTYTLTLPTTWHTSNDLVIAFTANSTITGGSTMVTTLTIINGAGQTLSQSVIPNTAQAGEIIRYHLIGTVDQRYN